jgi:hypothetical protein
LRPRNSDRDQIGMPIGFIGILSQHHTCLLR